MLERTVIKFEITSAKQMEAAGRRLGKAVLDPRLYDKDVYVALYAPHRSGKTTLANGIEASLPQHLRHKPDQRSFTEDFGHKNYPWYPDEKCKQEEPLPRSMGKAKIHVAEHDFLKNIVEYYPGVVILVSYPNARPSSGGINNESYFAHMENALEPTFSHGELPEAGKFLAEQLSEASEDQADGSNKRIVRIFLTTQDPDIRAKFLELAEKFEPKPSPPSLNERLRCIGAHP